MATTENHAPQDSSVKPKTTMNPNAHSLSVYRKGATSASSSRRTRLTVDEQGEFAYKKTPSSTLMASIQLGLQHAISSREPKPRRDILMTDFEVVDTVEFPSAGSGITPGHKYKDFTFKTYSPEAFRFFREAFGILAEDYLVALCDCRLRELGNPGASGSLFYLSADDVFIIKTVQKKEARFLQKLLPGYYLNLTQHKRTLLPKFFGLYRYKCGSVNIRIVVMNNLLPSTLTYHEKYDLKGSTYKRRAGPHEIEKTSPTFKDCDFTEQHKEGIYIVAEKYKVLIESLERDCKVLESFGIMDYSLLVGVHNIDMALRERNEAETHHESRVGAAAIEGASRADMLIPTRIELSKNFSIISVEDIPLVANLEQAQPLLHYPEGYIQGHLPSGDRVLLYLGIIDILQSYRLKKKLEHSLKAFITDGNTVSVHNPSYYSSRFLDFVGNQVFKKEKVRFRGRKNSTNAQMRSRKQATGMPRSVLRGPLQRQGSKDVPDGQTNPQFDSTSNPPVTLGAAPPQPIRQPEAQKDPDVRPIPNSRDPNLPEIPSLEVCSPISEHEEPIEQEHNDALLSPVSSDTHHDPHEHDKDRLETEAEGAEFASNVKGTSTPVNGGSPNVESNRAVETSQTFELTASTQANDISETVSTEWIQTEVKIMVGTSEDIETEKDQNLSRDDSETAQSFY